MPGIAEIEIAGRRARRPPERAGQRLLHRLLDRAVEPIIGDEIAVAILPRFLEPGQRSDQFVVAAPEHDRGMRGEPAHLVIDLDRYIVEEILGRGVEVAGEHEILPDHEAQPVAKIVEMILLVEAAAPDADHVHIGGFGRLQQILGLLRRRQRKQRVGRDPVGAAAEDLAAVDLEGEAAAGCIRRGDQLDGAKTDLLGHLIRRQFDG